MSEQTNAKQQQRRPRNIFEQMAFALETINDNITDLYKLTVEIHSALYNLGGNDKSEPNDHGAGTNNNQ